MDASDLSGMPYSDIFHQANQQLRFSWLRPVDAAYYDALDKAQWGEEATLSFSEWRDAVRRLGYDPIHETRHASQLHMLERLIQHRNILVRHSNNGEMSLFKTINAFDVTFKRLIDATRQVHTIADIGDGVDVSDAEEHLEHAFHLFVEPFPVPDGMTARPSLRLVKNAPTKETTTL